MILQMWSSQKAFQAKGATFVTTNAQDFWRKIPAHDRYCVVCFPLPNERIEEVPELLRRLLRLKEFRTKAARLGKVIRASTEEIRYYQAGDPAVYALQWPQDEQKRSKRERKT